MAADPYRRRNRPSPAREVMARLNELALITDEPGTITRTFLSPAMRRANARVGEWMKAEGLSMREDHVGNLIGRLEPTDVPPRSVKTLLLGSHLDTVKNAGRFDGPLGVLLPLAALSELRRRGVRLPYAIEVLGFSEEEGVRFSSAYLGSKGYSGQLRARDLAFTDANGISVEAALATLKPRGTPLQPAQRRRHEFLGYVEVHIEQGPVLEAKNLAVGVVSAIAGQTRARLTFIGKAGHAGTTPMALRRDAFAAAAEFAVAVETLARRELGLVATVGTMTLSPGAPNVIPAEACFTLDLRHAQDGVRLRALKTLRAAADKIARLRRLTFTWLTTQENAAVTCSPGFTRSLERSVKAVQGKSLTLVSGAGHDAVVMSARMPVAMLFVRSRDGLSHHPDEYSSPADIAVALAVLVDFLQRLAKSE